MTNAIHESESAASSAAQTESGLRLWVEFGTTAIAWHCLNFLNCIVVWRACVHQEAFGGPSPHPGARIVFFVLWVVIFGIAIISGVMSYRTWRKLSVASGLLSAEGRERKEYMSLCGVFVTFILGFGFLWLSLPLFILQMCLRTR